MIHTPKKSRGKLKPRMVKLPKYAKKIDGKRREMSNVEKCMIIAFFGVISTVSHLVGRPWSTVKKFLHRCYKRGTVENLPRTVDSLLELREIQEQLHHQLHAVHGVLDEREGPDEERRGVVTAWIDHVRLTVAPLVNLAPEQIVDRNRPWEL
jgi:hypothetical protein